MVVVVANVVAVVVAAGGDGHRHQRLGCGGRSCQSWRWGWSPSLTPGCQLANLVIGAGHGSRSRQNW